MHREGQTIEQLQRDLQSALDALRARCDEEGNFGRRPVSTVAIVQQALGVVREYAAKMHAALGELGLRGGKGVGWVSLEGDITYDDAEAIYYNRPTPYQWRLARERNNQAELRELVRHWLGVSVHRGDRWRYQAGEHSFELRVARLQRPEPVPGAPRDLVSPLPDVRLTSPVPYVAALAAGEGPDLELIPGAQFCGRALLGELRLLKAGRPRRPSSR
jgi:hypothetical protein